MQQYELNLVNRGCNSRRPPRIEDVCGEFNCDDLIFPFYGDDNRIKFIWKSGEMTSDGKPILLYPPDYAETENKNKNTNGTSSNRFSFNFRKLDIRLVVFITVLPIVLIGMLIFSLEIIIYVTCLRLVT